MMLYKGVDIILPETLQLLEELQSDPALKSFFLVGGTALALQIGHRFSVDLDLFTTEAFDVQQLEKYLVENYNLHTDNVAAYTIRGSISNIKTDFLQHAYPLVKSLFKTEHLRLASIEDIAAMKLNAISISGQRLKDFIDIYFLLERMSLEEMLIAYENKYSHSNKLIPMKALVYFGDLNTSQTFPKMVHKLTWKKIEARLVAAVKKPYQVFN